MGLTQTGLCYLPLMSEARAVVFVNHLGCQLEQTRGSLLTGPHGSTALRAHPVDASGD
jgi:hypothetical protein